MPLLDILKLRDHVNTTIDYLKMDVEGDEIDGIYDFFNYISMPTN